MSNKPHCSSSILLIEAIASINEQKSKVFFHVVRIPQMLHEMDTTLNSCF